MAAARRMLLLIAVAAISAQSISAQQSKEVSITEPGIYELAGLFKQADTVAIVRVIAGDAEAYNVAVYKAEVVQSFKGAAAGETVYFGPYTGTRLGWEYILFLRKVPGPIEPKSPLNASFGTIHYAEVLNQGYGSMEASYQCAFDGRDTSQKCDYGVRVCTDYIKLPRATATFPLATEETPFGCRLVRKTVFISLLEELANPGK